MQPPPCFIYDGTLSDECPHCRLPGSVYFCGMAIFGTARETLVAKSHVKIDLYIFGLCTNVCA